MSEFIKPDNESTIQMENKAAIEEHQQKNLRRSISESLEYTKHHEGIYLQGENKSTNHKIFEMNEFYIEMVDRLKKLRLDYMEEEELIDEDESCGGDGDSLLSEVVNAIKKKRNDPEIKRQIETILKLDMEISDNNEILKIERSERESYQNDICNELKNEENLDKYSEQMYQLCKLDSEAGKLNKKETSAGAKEDKLGEGNRCKKSAKSEENQFIRRNIQLAKNSQEMGNLSLTDEEKIKLENLLVDVDTIVDDGNAVSEEDEVDSQDTGYHFDDGERSLLDALDEKLKDFGKCIDNGDAPESEQSEKFWKIEQRLRNIEEELLNYQMDKEKSAENEEDTVEVEADLLKCPPEIEPTDDIKEMAMKLVENYENEYGLEAVNLLEETSDFEEALDVEEAEKRCFDEVYDQEEVDIIRRVREVTTGDE